MNLKSRQSLSTAFSMCLNAVNNNLNALVTLTHLEYLLRAVKHCSKDIKMYLNTNKSFEWQTDRQTDRQTERHTYKYRPAA